MFIAILNMYVTHDQLKRDIYVKEHKYGCKN